LIVSDKAEEYDGVTAIVRSHSLEAEEIEFLRWRAERWLMIRHMPYVLRHNPVFCIRHMRQVLGHYYQGCTLKSLLHLEDERKAFARYRALHQAQRQYV
jgi:hypothetical protein